MPKVICFEGINKSGKGTQIELLKNYLKELFIVKVVKFPSSNNEFGIKARELLSKEHDPVVMQCYQTIDKYLEQSSIFDSIADYVLIDRFQLSFYAYGYATGVSNYHMRNLAQLIDLKPIYIYLDISFETSLKRQPEGRDLYEVEKIESKALERLRQLAECDATLWTVFKVDGEQSEEEVHKEILKKLGLMYKGEIRELYLP